MPKYRVGFVIAVYEGLKVDWVAIITECLKDVIEYLQREEILDGSCTMVNIISTSRPHH